MIQSNQNITILAIFILLLIICVCCFLSSKKNSDNKIKDIHIDKDLYQEMVNIVTKYSLMSENYEHKLLLIYLSTFHLFDMNYDCSSIKKLDKQLESYPYEANKIEYPVGELHINLQKAIISNITISIDKSKHSKLVHSQREDKFLIDIYLRKLFEDINIIE